MYKNLLTLEKYVKLAPQKVGFIFGPTGGSYKTPFEEIERSENNYLELFGVESGV